MGVIEIFAIVLFAITVILALLGKLPWERAIIISVVILIVYAVIWLVASRA